ncbi:Type IV leader peptidase family protein [Eubacterium uniforme]|uniref:Type IV leader peptidase family protein n=1 Tax=Eubacterium uniforme TaxID=39495 RepID=A0A1T4VMF3_9FIRM|nr:prepilin peptidase [Eubacterium uniforme]SKA66140.1 Type IV leader peptidase family protein [Eubacterium uniforme]
MRDVLIASGSGVILGIIFYFLAIYQVSVRAQFTDADTVKKIKDRRWMIVWIVILIVIYNLIFLTGQNMWMKAMFSLFVAMAFNVSAVDIALRRIPNALLLGMMLLKIADIVIGGVYGKSNVIETLFYTVISMIAIYILCTLPSIVGITMGAGDIKYCSVLGFVFGIVGFAQAMIVMSILLVFYWMYLKKTKTGNMKTATPMGPFLSIGALLPIFIILC